MFWKWIVKLFVITGRHCPLCLGSAPMPTVRTHTALCMRVAGRQLCFEANQWNWFLNEAEEAASGSCYPYYPPYSFVYQGQTTACIAWSFWSVTSKHILSQVLCQYLILPGLVNTINHTALIIQKFITWTHDICWVGTKCNLQCVNMDHRINVCMYKLTLNTVKSLLT